MAIRIEQVGDVIVVVPEGVLTGEPKTDELQSTLEGLIERGQKKILVNLEKTPFVTSRAFGVLIATHTSAQKRNIALYTCGMQERVKKVIQIIRVKGWPKQFDTYEQGLEALQEL